MREQRGSNSDAAKRSTNHGVAEVKGNGKYSKLPSGVFRISSRLSGMEVSEVIHQIITSEGGRPPIRFECSGSSGHADYIGMHCKVTYGINLDIERNEHTGELNIFYLEERN